MKIYLVIMSLCLFAFPSFAASKTTAGTKAATALKSVDGSVSRDTVFTFLNESNTIFTKGEKNGRPASAIKYLSVSAVVKNWLILRFLEVDTEIDISWYNRVFAYLDYMAKAKQFLDTAGMNGKADTSEYKEVDAKFDEVRKRFGEAIKKPTPVNEKKLAKLRDEKRKWESEKRREEGGKG
jgi:hypothetical protein